MTVQFHESSIVATAKGGNSGGLTGTFVDFHGGLHSVKRIIIRISVMVTTALPKGQVSVNPESVYVYNWRTREDSNLRPPGP